MLQIVRGLEYDVVVSDSNKYYAEEVTTTDTAQVIQIQMQFTKDKYYTVAYSKSGVDSAISCSNAGYQSNIVADQIYTFQAADTYTCDINLTLDASTSHQFFFGQGAYVPPTNKLNLNFENFLVYSHDGVKIRNNGEQAIECKQLSLQTNIYTIAQNQQQNLDNADNLYYCQYLGDGIYDFTVETSTIQLSYSEDDNEYDDIDRAKFMNTTKSLSYADALITIDNTDLSYNTMYTKNIMYFEKDTYLNATMADGQCFIHTPTSLITRNTCSGTTASTKLADTTESNHIYYVYSRGTIPAVQNLFTPLANQYQQYQISFDVQFQKQGQQKVTYQANNYKKGMISLNTLASTFTDEKYDNSIITARTRNVNQIKMQLKFQVETKITANVISDSEYTFTGSEQTNYTLTLNGKTQGYISFVIPVGQRSGSKFLFAASLFISDECEVGTPFILIPGKTIMTQGFAVCRFNKTDDKIFYINSTSIATNKKLPVIAQVEKDYNYIYYSGNENSQYNSLQSYESASGTGHSEFYFEDNCIYFSSQPPMASTTASILSHYNISLVNSVSNIGKGEKQITIQQDQASAGAKLNPIDPSLGISNSQDKYVLFCDQENIRAELYNTNNHIQKQTGTFSSEIKYQTLTFDSNLQGYLQLMSYDTGVQLATENIAINFDLYKLHNDKSSYVDSFPFYAQLNQSQLYKSGLQFTYEGSATVIAYICNDLTLDIAECEQVILQKEDNSYTYIYQAEDTKTRYLFVTVSDPIIPSTLFTVNMLWIQKSVNNNEKYISLAEQDNSQKTDFNTQYTIVEHTFVAAQGKLYRIQFDFDQTVEQILIADNIYEYSQFIANQNIKTNVNSIQYDVLSTKQQQKTIYIMIKSSQETLLLSSLSYEIINTNPTNYNANAQLYVYSELQSNSAYPFSFTCSNKEKEFFISFVDNVQGAIELDLVYNDLNDQQQIVKYTAHGLIHAVTQDIKANSVVMAVVRLTSGIENQAYNINIIIKDDSNQETITDNQPKQINVIANVEYQYIYSTSLNPNLLLIETSKYLTSDEIYICIKQDINGETIFQHPSVYNGVFYYEIQVNNLITKKNDYIIVIKTDKSVTMQLTINKQISRPIIDQSLPYSWSKNGNSFSLTLPQAILPIQKDYDYIYYNNQQYSQEQILSQLSELHYKIYDIKDADLEDELTTAFGLQYASNVNLLSTISAHQTLESYVTLSFSDSNYVEGTSKYMIQVCTDISGTCTNYNDVFTFVKQKNSNKNGIILGVTIPILIILIIIVIVLVILSQKTKKNYLKQRNTKSYAELVKAA